MITEEQLKEMPPDERLEFLKNHADNVEEGLNFFPYNDEQLYAVERETVKQSLHIDNLENEFADIKDEWKRKLKAENAILSNHKTNVRQRGEHRDGIVFHFADHEARTLYTFDEQGNEVNKRRLKHDEYLQTTIGSGKLGIRKTG